MESSFTNLSNLFKVHIHFCRYDWWLWVTTALSTMLKQLFPDCLKPAAWQFLYFSVHISSHLSHLLSTIKPLVTFWLIILSILSRESEGKASKLLKWWEEGLWSLLAVFGLSLTASGDVGKELYSVATLQNPSHIPEEICWRESAESLRLL